MKVTNDDNEQWLKRELGELDEDGILWSFPADERKRLRGRVVASPTSFSDLMESDMDEKLILFRATHPEIQDKATLWNLLLEDLNGQTLGAEATKRLNLMIQETSYETVVYLASLYVHAAVMRVEIGDRSASPVQATWRTRPIEIPAQ